MESRSIYRIFATDLHLVLQSMGTWDWRESSVMQGWKNRADSTMGGESLKKKIRAPTRYFFPWYKNFKARGGAASPVTHSHSSISLNIIKDKSRVKEKPPLPIPLEKGPETILGPGSYTSAIRTPTTEVSFSKTGPVKIHGLVWSTKARSLKQPHFWCPDKQDKIETGPGQQRFLALPLG